MRFKDKVAIVTGGSSGIGRSIATKLAEGGAKVCVADVREEPREGGKPTHVRIREEGGEAIFSKTDVRSLNSVQETVEEVIGRYGGINILVNNAGIFIEEKIHELGMDNLENVIDVNLRGVFLFSREVLKHMLERGIEGNIVNISSIAGLVGWESSPAYSASKGGILSLTREMAVDYAPEKINVNAVCPGVIRTSMTEKFLKDEEMRDFMEKNIPYPRLGKPRDIANAVAFLASEESDFINGEEIAVDGGWTAH